MQRKFFISGLIVVIIVSGYLLALSFDVLRLQKRSRLAGTHSLYVFSYGWHTGLVLNREKIPAPYKKYFALWQKHHWVEISWGDDQFYRNKTPGWNWPLAIRAIAWPTRSVLHVMGFDMPLEHLYGTSGMVHVYLSRKEYAALLDFVTSFFPSDTTHPYGVLERGLYGDSYFLKSKGKYVFPFTCNVWTARALKAAGIPLTPVLYQLSGVLMRALREMGKTHAPVGKRVKYVKVMEFDAGNSTEF